MADSQGVFQNEETVPTKLCEPSGDDDVITDMLHEWESETDGWMSFPVDDLVLNMPPLDFEIKADNSLPGLSNEKRGTSKKVEHRKAVTKTTIWRKYGKKNILHKGKAKAMVRCYYKCKYKGCDGKKVNDYVNTLLVGSHMTNPHSKNYCGTKACSLRLPEDGVLKPEDIGRLADTHAPPVYRIERLLATCAEIVCINMRISVTSTDSTISEAFADSHLDVSAWVGQSLCTVCKQMVQTEESARPMNARFYRSMVALPSGRTAYALLKIKTVDDKSEHATIMISKEDCTF